MTLAVPEFSTHITEPLDADVTVDFEIGIITGSFTRRPAPRAGRRSGRDADVRTGRNAPFDDPDALDPLDRGKQRRREPALRSAVHPGSPEAGAIAGQWTDMNATRSPGDGDRRLRNRRRTHRRAGRHLAGSRRRRRPPSAPQLSEHRPGLAGLRAALRGSSAPPRRDRPCASMRARTARARRSPPGAQPSLARPVSPSGRGGGHRRLLGDRHRCGRQHLGLLGADLIHAYEGDRSLRRHLPACIVPKAGRQDAGAGEEELRAANCKLGKVRKPKRTKGQRTAGPHRQVVESRRRGRGPPTARSTSSSTGSPRKRKRATTRIAPATAGRWVRRRFPRRGASTGH